MDWNTEPQPDLCLFITNSDLGQARLDEDDYVSGVPELMIEISASSASYDLGPKLAAYRRNRVQEYLIWRTEDSAIDWLRWRDGDYVPLAADAEGVVRSEVFPGLWLSIPDLLADRMPQVFATLNLGLQSPEHAAFVARLAEAGPAA